MRNCKSGDGCPIVRRESVDTMAVPTPRLRLLLVTRNLPPLVGGMERLNWHMAQELAHRADVRVVGPRGAAALAPPGVAVEEAPLKPLWRFLLGAQWRALRRARQWRPDVILAGSGLVAPIAWLAARLCGARAAVYVHGLDIAVRHKVYRALWHPLIRRMDTVIANSNPTRDLAIAMGVRPERIGIVHPGVDVSTDALPPQAVAEFRVRHQLGQRPVLLSVGRLSRRKGLREFVSDVLPAVAAVMPDVLLLIVGDAPTQALHAQAQTPQSIQKAADAHGVGGNIKFLGVIVDRAELAAIYRAAHIHVFPVQHIPHDPEGFGMVAIEAAAHGLPTVAYATGGVIDAVAEGQSGHLVAPGDTQAMAKAILDTLRTPGALAASSRAFATRFDWPVFGDHVFRCIAPPSPGGPQP